MQQLIESGKIENDDVTRTWDAADDADTRGSHNHMDGQPRKGMAPFTSGLGNALRFPLDPLAPIEDTAQCRCVVRTKIDYLARLGRG